MPSPSSGITAAVIQEMMPPYQLSQDLLAAAVAALAPPPAGAGAPARHARLMRLVQEIGGLMPADAPQARLAAQIVITREAADDSLARAHAPGLTVEQVCRLRRVAAELTRAAATLERMLGRRQEKPAPFFGTVLADGVDIGALDLRWGGGGAEAAAQEVAPAAEAAAGPDDAARAAAAAAEAGAAGARAPLRIVSPAAADDRTGAAPPGEDAAVPADDAGPAAAALAAGGGAFPASRITRLEEGPGWTLDVVRPVGRERAGRR